MSRLGKLPIELIAGTQVKIEKDFIVVKGAKGELRTKLHSAIKIEITEKDIKIAINNIEDKKEKSLWGLYRSLINNMVEGVNKGFVRKLEINGVGYRAAIAGSKLTVNAGYSHPVIYDLPVGVTGIVEANTITLSSADKQLVGETAAQIRRIRKPEPYKGKGIKYAEEVIRRKAGKTATKGK